MRGVRRLSARVTGGGRELADNFIRDGIDDWAAEGHLDDAQRRRLTETLETPEATAATASLGAHLAMSVPLRFPFGSIARFMWTVAARGRAEWAALRGRSSARVARRVHTVPVALMGLVPGFGAGAYLLAKPLRCNRALASIIFDRLLRKMPLRIYWRLHLSALTTWFARPAARPVEGPVT